MKISVLSSWVIFFIAMGCQPKIETSKSNASVSIDTTPRITGIGGIFFASNQPDSLKQWYADNLGMKTDEYGSVFEFRNSNQPNELNYLRWSAFSKSDTFLSPSKKEFMINYRVFRINELVSQMKSKGVVFADTIATYDYGKFVHFIDPEGNKVELWEPVDSVLTKMGGITNK